jgi:hypothetical protein
MRAMLSSDPPTHRNGWVANALIYQRSGGFLRIGWIFPTALMCVCARAHVRGYDINNPPDPPVNGNQSIGTPYFIGFFDRSQHCIPAHDPPGARVDAKLRSGAEYSAERHGDRGDHCGRFGSRRPKPRYEQQRSESPQQLHESKTSFRYAEGVVGGFNP